MPALDLAITLTATNQVLDLIHHALRPTLFCAQGAQGHATDPGFGTAAPVGQGAALPAQGRQAFAA